MAYVPGQHVVHAELFATATWPGWHAVHESDAKSLYVPVGQPAQSPVVYEKCWPAGQLQTVAAQAEGSKGSAQEKLFEPPDKRHTDRMVVVPRFEGSSPLNELFDSTSVCSL